MHLHNNASQVFHVLTAIPLKRTISKITAECEHTPISTSDEEIKSALSEETESVNSEEEAVEEDDDDDAFTQAWFAGGLPSQ